MPKSLVLVVLVLFSALSASTVSCKKAEDGNPRLGVVVSVFPLADLTRRVAGPDADVTSLSTATSGDAQAAAISHARLAVMVGLGFDPWMEHLAMAPKARSLKLGDRVPTLPAVGGAGDDPYVWLDPERTRLMVRAIAEELGRADAAHAIAYRTRATEIDASLAALDKDLESRTKALGEQGLVVSSGSLPYFAERYKLVFTPKPGGETAIDPIGGGPDTDSYEKMMRVIMATLERH